MKDIDIKKIADYSDDIISKKLLIQEELIGRTLKRLEDRLLDMSAEFLGGEKKPRTFAFSQAKKLHVQLYKIFGLEFDPAIKSMIAGYADVERLIEKEFKIKGIVIDFDRIDKSMFDALKRHGLAVYETLKVESINRISQAIYDTVIIGQPFSYLTNQIRGILREGDYKGVKGRSLETYSRVYAQDSLMQYYSTIQKKKSKDAGLKHFLYYGNLMADSRPFCASIVGKVFTEKQINAMNKLDWTGKSGDIWIHRGGYSCRHSWVSVKPDWIEEKDLKAFESEKERHLQDMDKKDKEKITDMDRKISGVIK